MSYSHFHAEAQSVSLIFSEIMADPEPAVGLPVAEYVELYNAGSEPIDLNGWVFADRSTQSELDNQNLLPGKYLLLCAEKDTALLMPFGKVMGLDPWPRLNNGDDDLTLYNEMGQIQDQLTYDRTWYKNTSKDDGGYSLESLNPNSLCDGKGNWSASRSENGGTPGQQNSYEDVTDLSPPGVVDVWLTYSSELEIRFDEPIAPANPEQIHIELSGSLSYDSIYLKGTNIICIRLTREPEVNRKEEVRVSNIRDCSGNLMIEPESRSFVLPDQSQLNDVVINEVLFNPHPAGVDFVELYNRSEKYINLRGWSIGNYEDSLHNRRTLIHSNHIIEPGEFRVLTSDKTNILDNYPASHQSTFIDTDLPGLPNESGSFAIENEQEVLIDQMKYHEDMHFKILQDQNGVSLERIDPNGLSGDPNNWKSAAEVENFATPGYRNSQIALNVAGHGNILIAPKIITPDSDGRDDFTRINYRFDQPGYIANVRIFNPEGREIRIIANNALLGTEGFFQWDGIDNRGRKARTGYYLVHFQYFDLQGKTGEWRDGVVVGISF